MATSHQQIQLQRELNISPGTKGKESTTQRRNINQMPNMSSLKERALAHSNEQGKNLTNTSKDENHYKGRFFIDNKVIKEEIKTFKTTRPEMVGVNNTTSSSHNKGVNNSSTQRYWPRQLNNVAPKAQTHL